MVLVDQQLGRLCAVEVGRANSPTTAWEESISAVAQITTLYRGVVARQPCRVEAIPARSTAAEERPQGVLIARPRQV